MAVEIVKIAMRGILTSSTMSLLRDGNVVPAGAFCAVSVVLGHSRTGQDSLHLSNLPERTSQYLDDLTLCKFIDDMVEVWEPGCTNLFEEIFSEDNYLLCNEALHCRDNIDEPDIVHGACLPACENDEEDGTVCKKPWIIQAGLMHERVCPSLPVVTQYSYMSHWDMLFMIAVILFDFGTDLLLSALTGDEKVTITLFDFFNAIVQMSAILSVLAHAYHIVWGKDGVDRPSLCGYVALATAQFFGPFMFSTSNIIRIGFKALGLATLEQEKADKGVDSGTQVCLCCTLFLVVPCLVVVGVVILFQMLALVTMCIVSFWGVFAYIHIFLIICIETVVLVGCALSPAWLADGNEAFEQKALPTLPALYAALSPVTMLGSGTFLLYAHADWMKLHNAFFEDIQIPGLSIPNPFEMLVHFGHLMEVFADMMTFQDVLPSAMFQVAMLWSFLTFLGNLMWRAVGSAGRKFLSK